MFACGETFFGGFSQADSGISSYWQRDPNFEDLVAKIPSPRRVGQKTGTTKGTRENKRPESTKFFCLLLSLLGLKKMAAMRQVIHTKKA